MDAALFSAVAEGDLVVRAREALAAGASINAVNDLGLTFLMESIQADRAEIARMLLADGRLAIDTADRAGSSALLALCLARGANVNLANAHSETALMRAAEKGDVAAVALLLSRGARLDVADRDGATAVFAAASAGHASLVGALAARGADVNRPIATDQRP